MKPFFSLFSGEVYTLDEKYTNQLDCGQLEITNTPKTNCKHCYGKGYTFKDTKTLHYVMCKCLLRDASPSFIKKSSEHQVQDVRLHTKKDDFNS